MKLTTPKDKELTDLDKALITIEEKFANKENGKEWYQISVHMPLREALAKAIVRKYTEIGWKVSYIQFTEKKGASSYVNFNFERK